MKKSLLDAVGFCCLPVLFCFPSTGTLRSFIMLLGIHFCTSLLPFVILPVLVSKYPFPIFYHISSKSINEPSFAFLCMSVSLQTLKPHFSRAPIKNAGTRIRLTSSNRRRMRAIQNILLFKCNGQYGKYQIIF